MYCLIGDGESAEGAVWEALHFSSQYRLDNLVAVFDINRLGQSEATSLQHDMDIYQRRLTAFGLVFLSCLFYIFITESFNFCQQLFPVLHVLMSCFFCCIFLDDNIVFSDFTLAWASARASGL